jgi:Met-10+ like-protein
LIGTSLLKQKKCLTYVPGQDPIELISYYPEFSEYYGYCEPQTKQWFTDHIQEDWICIDAGANIGYHSILMARMAKKGHVFAFEPTETIEMLKKNIKHNGVKKNITVEKYGLGARNWVGFDRIYKGEENQKKYKLVL